MGAFLFAWAADGYTAFSESEHGIDGQDVFFVRIEQTEGEFATLTVDIVNPREGLLNPHREQWAYLSWEESDGITPVFFGRLQGVPDDLQAEIVRLTFIARPPDFEERKAALAETLKLAPFYDPVWVAPDRINDPDTVLEGYNALWHIDRVTHEVSVSDNLRGEDGTINLMPDVEFYDDLRMTIGAAPLSQVNVAATVKWSQAAAGELDATAELLQAFHAVSPAHGLQLIGSYTGESLVRTWPEKGKSIGGGFLFGDSSIQVLSGTAVSANFTSVKIKPQAAPVDRLPGMSDAEYEAAVAQAQAAATANPIREARFYVWIMRPTLKLVYQAARERSEAVSFSIVADVQNVLADEEGRSADIALSSNSIAAPIDGEDASGSGTASDSAGGGQLPIGDIRRNTFFNLDRGKQSIETLICFARAALLLSARCVDVGGRVAIFDGFQFSCRKDGLVTDDRLPGGTAAGKVTSYAIVHDPQSGEQYAEFSLGCTAGRGASIGPATPGVADYIEDDYIAATYYQHFGGSVIPLAGEIEYDDFLQPINDDGLDLANLTAAEVIDSLLVTGGESAQAAFFDDNEFPTVQDAITQLNAQAATRVTLTMKSLTGGPFSTEFPLSLSPLMVPKTVDLEAEAVS